MRKVTRTPSYLLKRGDMYYFRCVVPKPLLFSNFQTHEVMHLCGLEKSLSYENPLLSVYPKFNFCLFQIYHCLMSMLFQQVKKI